MEASRYAIIEAQGLQLRVAPEEEHLLPNLGGDPGSEIAFDRVLLIADGGKVQIGRPHLAGATVRAQIIGHGKGPKVEVATFKRRKKVRRHIGYRSQLTRVKILGIEA